MKPVIAMTLLISLTLNYFYALPALRNSVETAKVAYSTTSPGIPEDIARSYAAIEPGVDHLPVVGDLQ